MKTFTKLASILMLACLTAFGQATMTQTTLSAAVTAAGNGLSTILVASATGITAPGPNRSALVVLYVDREAMEVQAVSSTTITVFRGAKGTARAGHVSGATVWVGPDRYYATGITAQFSGSCTAANLVVLPIVHIPSGDKYYCGSDGAYYKISGPSQLINLTCTGTVGSAETEFLNVAACSGATAATTRRLVISAGILDNFRVYSSAVAVGGTNKDVATVLKNGSATSLTCTIAAMGTTCSDTTHYVAVAAGDVITVSLVTATSDTAANISASVDKF